MEDAVAESERLVYLTGEAEIVPEAEEENGTKKQQCSESNDGGGSGRGLIEQIVSHLPVSIPGFAEASPPPAAEESSNEKREAEENGPDLQQHPESNGGGSGGGLIEQIISHFPVSIPGFSEPSSEPSAGEFSDENGNCIEAAEAKAVAEAEGIFPVPDDPGPDPEEASFLISIIRD